MSAFLLHLAVVLVFPPLLLGVINRVKAGFAGRRGPPLLQAYWDVAKLLEKGSVFSKTTTWIFRAGPVVSLTAVLAAALIVPLGARTAPLTFAGDAILFVYLFGLGRFFTVAAALDTGSAFEGMGGAREVTFSCLAEPAMFLALIVLARQVGSLSLSSMLSADMTGVTWAAAAIVLVLASMFIVLLAENSRVPFDDPNTHLELTMIHEVMVLDHGGPALGLVTYGAAMKLFVLGAVIVRLASPATSGSGPVDWAIFLGGMIALAALVGAVESVMARLRLVHVPRLLVASCVLASFGVLLGGAGG